MVVPFTAAAQSVAKAGNGPPANLDGGAFQSLVDGMWRDSDAFRRQCIRLAHEPSIRVTVRAEIDMRALARSTNRISRKGARIVSAEIVLRSPRDTVELIGHEIEHIIEQLDGVELRTHSCVSSNNTDRVYETCRAVEVGRQIAREVEQARNPRLLTVRQHDRFSGPLDEVTTSVSANGRLVVLRSSARLVAEDVDDQDDLYVMDLHTGTLHLETRPGWADHFSGFLRPAISGDGSVLAFRALTADSSSPTGVSWRIVVLDRIAGVHDVVSLPAQANVRREYGVAAVSADGAAIAVESSLATRGGGGGRFGIYLLRLQSGSREPVSVAAGSTPTIGHGVTPSISADGRYVAFMSGDDLTCGKSRSCRSTDLDRNKKADIYVRDTMEGTTVRVSRSASGGDADGPSSWPSISADGRYVAFTSEASNLTTGDSNRQADVFVFDSVTRVTELVSHRRDGKAGDGASRYPAISGDGNTVAFQSLASDLICTNRCALHERDINLLWDVFVFDRRSGKTERVSSDERSEWMSPSHGPSLDHAAHVLAFSSRHPIDEADASNDDDLYVRIRGRRESR